MAIPLTSIGVKISYCVESVKGTRPTTGYTPLPGLKSSPDMNVAPSTADVTTFDNLEYTSKVQLLKEMPDNLEFNANFSQDLYDKWSVMKTAFDELSGGKAMWFCIDIPGFNKAIFITGEPAEMGLPSMEANSAVEVTLYVTPTSEPVFETKPTEYVGA